MTHLSRLTPFVVACVLVLSAARPAQAQFGGLINRAKEKVTEKAKENVGPVAAGEQLTEDLLGKVVTGAQAANRVLAERDQAQAAREAKNKDLSALIEKNAPVHQAYNEANSKIMSCRSASLNSLERARNKRFDAEVKARQADPALMGKMQLIGMKYSKAIADAQQKQDPVALTKAQTAMMKEMLGTDVFADLKKDSVTTDAKCGKVPPQPAALVHEESLRNDIAADDENIRTLEAKAVNQGAQASGLEQVRYLQLKERALSIMNRMNGQGAVVRYGDDETAAVKRRMGDLEKVKRAL